MLSDNLHLFLVNLNAIACHSGHICHDLHLLVTSADSKGRLNTPCLVGNVCVATNTACLSGVCLCAEGYFEKDSLCSKLSYFVY